MVDITRIESNLRLDSTRSRKIELENEINTLNNGAQVANKGLIYADYNYYSNLLSLMEKLSQKISQYKQAEQIIKTESDPELIAMANADIAELDGEISTLAEEIKQIEIAHKFEDPDDQKSVVIEIRAGAGGDEAALFAADLFRMYSHYADANNWQIEIIEESLSESAGYKLVIANIYGTGVYKKLKYESGVHRVQRIPSTEASGRIHTSTASVAILPEAKDVEVIIDPKDLRIDVMRASGAGGQCVNKTDSAVRITHIPTGIIVSCQETKHQAQNREKAMATLRAKLYDKKKKEEEAKSNSMRSSQIGSMMRAEKIRTYNFPQSRITDHRTKQSWFNLEEILNGSIDQMVKDIDDMILEIRLAEEVKE